MMLEGGVVIVMVPVTVIRRLRFGFGGVEEGVGHRRFVRYGVTTETTEGPFGSPRRSQ